MDFVGFKTDGIGWATLGAFGAADAFIRYFVSDQRQAFP
jgi:hypothetical protein